MGAKRHETVVVLINWFHAERTVSSIRQFEHWRKLHPRLIVVCNGDTEEGRALLRKACSKAALLIEMPENTGFSGANNAGIREALALGADRIGLINTDAEISETDFGRLLEAFDEIDHLAAAGPLVVEQQGDREIVYAGGRDISQWRQTRIQHAGNAGGAGAQRYTKPDYVMGTAMVANRAAWERVGLFDERYFFSGEVADWCERARGMGFQIAVDTTAQALHHTNLAGTAAREGGYLYYSLRNRFLFISKHRHDQRLRLYARWAATGVLEAAKAVLRGKRGRAVACLTAIRDGLAGHFGRRSPVVSG